MPTVSTTSLSSLSSLPASRLPAPLEAVPSLVFSSSRSYSSCRSSPLSTLLSDEAADDGWLESPSARQALYASMVNCSSDEDAPATTATVVTSPPPDEEWLPELPTEPL